MVTPLDQSNKWYMAFHDMICKVSFIPVVICCRYSPLPRTLLCSPYYSRSCDSLALPLTPAPTATPPFVTATSAPLARRSECQTWLNVTLCTPVCHGDL